MSFLKLVLRKYCPTWEQFKVLVKRPFYWNSYVYL